MDLELDCVPVLSVNDNKDGKAEKKDQGEYVGRDAMWCL